VDMKNKIVIADDEPITRLDLREILEKEGYDVVGEATDGFDAIEVCKRERPDLVLMDIKMPLLDGIKASKIIRDQGLATAIVLLTAYSGKEFLEKAKDVDVMGYLVKPIDEARLIPTVEIVIDKSKKIKAMKNELERASEKLEARKLIEKAKGILMKVENISEEEAYLRIRDISMNKRTSMRNIAEIIIMNECS